MPDAPPPRGADPVNDELEVGFNQHFEESWHRAELIGRVVIVLVIAAGLAGLFGRGPFSHDSARLPDGSLSSDFEPVARLDTPTQVTLHVHPPLGSDSVRIRLSSTVIEPLSLQTVQPQPAQESAEHGDLILRIAVPKGADEMLIRLHLQPAVLGMESLYAALDRGPNLTWSQFVVP